MKSSCKKVVVLTCNGIGMLVSTAARLAALRAQQLRPEHIIVLLINYSFRRCARLPKSQLTKEQL